jgi:Ala-tRNA(Pro) deacylase
MYVLDFLQSRGIWFETLLHRPACSAAKLAGSVHVPGRHVGKAVLVKAGHSFVLALLPSTAWIDLVRLSEVLGSPISDVRLATSGELFEIFNDCEPGVVPPFGRLYGLTTLVDLSLTESTEIVFGANTRHEGLRMRFLDFQALEDPVRASFTRPIAHCQPIAAKREPNRLAG